MDRRDALRPGDCAEWRDESSPAPAAISGHANAALLGDSYPVVDGRPLLDGAEAVSATPPRLLRAEKGSCGRGAGSDGTTGGTMGCALALTLPVLIERELVGRPESDAVE